MRVLITQPGPEFSVHDVYRGWEKALKGLGHQVLGFNLNHRLMYHGNSHLPAYPEGWNGTRQLPTCPTCGQPPYKKALEDDGVKTIATEEIFKDAYALWPDIILFISGFFYDENVFRILKARGHKLVMLHTESPYEDDRQMRIGEHMDLNLVNDPTRLAEWQEVGPAIYMPHAYDPEVHYPARSVEVAGVGNMRDFSVRDEEYESDFTFIGTGFKSRRDFFGQMDLSNIRWSIGGGGWGDAVDEPENRHLLDNLGHHPELCVDNEETAHQYRIARVGLNLYRKEGEDGSDYKGWSMGPREVEMAACEMFFIRDPRPESDELFGDLLPAFHSPEGAAGLIRWWSHPGKDLYREKIARLARMRIEGRTFDNHAKELMATMDDLGLL